MTRMRHAISGGLLIIAAAGGQAQEPERLAFSYDVGHIQMTAQWEAELLRPGTGHPSMIVAQSPAVELRLVLPPKYVAPPRRVRIFLVAPLTGTGIRNPGSLQLTWQTRGHFAAGAVRAGQRALVFEGMVEKSPFAERIGYTLRIDADDLSGPFQFEPYFEIEPA